MSKKFTVAELAQFNGKNGQSAYLAFKGNVYDVTNLFVDGEHAGVPAGIDLTANFAQGPHEENIFEKFPVVGTLVA